MAKTLMLRFNESVLRGALQFRILLRNENGSVISLGCHTA
jgi:hypothetical protein